MGFNFQHKVVFTDKASNSRVQRDTLDDAKDKIVLQLEVQKAWLLDSTKPRPSSFNTLPVVGGTRFGIKYGNRYLPKVFQDELTDPHTTYLVLQEADLPAAYDLAIKLVRDGTCDKQIAEAMAANVAIHAKS